VSMPRRRMTLLALVFFALVIIIAAGAWPRPGAWVTASALAGTWTAPGKPLVGAPTVVSLYFQVDGTGEWDSQLAQGVGMASPLRFAYRVKGGRVQIDYLDGGSSTLEIGSYSPLYLNVTANDSRGLVPSGRWIRRL
jgi:hypothetical protein